MDEEKNKATEEKEAGTVQAPPVEPSTEEKKEE